MPIVKSPEIGELIASTEGVLGYVIDCNEGTFHVEWAENNKTYWYYNSMVLLFRENLLHYYAKLYR